MRPISEARIVPGKVMLFGEYAALYGHPALVCAVARGVEVTIRPAPHLIIDGGAHGRAERTADGWRGDSLPFARRLVDALPAIPALECRLDSAPLTVDGVKLGLGSSAASTVALARACLPEASDAEIYARAQAAHRAVQGTGSGTDIAASTFGGALAYRWIEGPAPADAIVAGDGAGLIERLPATRTVLHLAWAGQPASTPALVGRVTAWAARDPAGHRALMDRLGAAAQAGIRAWRADGALRAAARETVAALTALGAASGAAIVTATHRALAAAVASLPVVVKPTGAGGGDLAWIAGDDPEAERAAAVRLAQAGFAIFSLRIADRAAI